MLTSIPYFPFLNLIFTKTQEQIAPKVSIKRSIIVSKTYLSWKNSGSIITSKTSQRTPITIVALTIITKGFFTFTFIKLEKKMVHERNRATQAPPKKCINMSNHEKSQYRFISRATMCRIAIIKARKNTIEKSGVLSMGYIIKQKSP
jgi:hypothetical protein